MLRSIGLLFFVFAGILMLATSQDANTRMIGWLDIIFFGGLGSLAALQTWVVQSWSAKRLVAGAGLLLLSFCGLFLARHAELVGNRESLLANPVTVRLVGDIVFPVCLAGASWAFYQVWDLRWLPKTPEAAEQMAQAATRRWQERQIVTREWMLASIEGMNGVIHCMSPFYFDIRGPATPPEILIDEWVANNKAEWFGVFLEIVAHPPETDNLWQYSVAQLMQAWVLQNPDRFFPEIKTALQKEDIGPAMFEALTALAKPRILNSPERREQLADWLAPFVEQAQDLSELEQELLIDAVGGFTEPQGHPLRFRLQERLAGATEDVRQYMARVFQAKPLETEMQ